MKFSKPTRYIDKFLHEKSLTIYITVLLLLIAVYFETQKIRTARKCKIFVKQSYQRENIRNMAAAIRFSCLLLKKKLM